MTRRIALALAVLVAVGGCSTTSVVATAVPEGPATQAPATPVPPTPIIIYVTPTPLVTIAPTAAPTPSPVPTAAPTPIAFVGAGMSKTKPFVTTSGHFSVAYALGCDGFFAASIYTTAGESVDHFGSVIGNKVSGSTEEYLKPGSYYFDVSAGCPWTLTVTEES